MPKKYNPYLEPLLVVALGIVSYCLHFFSYFDEFSSAIFFFNDPDDAKVYAWNTWHFAHQIKQGAYPFYTDYICSPNGTSLWMHAYTIWFGLLHLIIGNIAMSINLGIAIQLVVSFVGFYRLARYFDIQYLLAISAAYLGVFNTYVLAKVGVHYNLVLIGVLPFILLSFLKWMPYQKGFRMNKKRALPTVLLLLVGFFMDYYVVFYSLAFGAVYLLWFWVLDVWFSFWSWKKMSVLLGALVLGHISIRLLRILGIDEKGAIWAAADVRGLVNQGLNSRFFQNNIFGALPHALNDNKIFLGYSFIALFILSLLFYVQQKDKDKWTRFFLFATTLFTFVTLPVIRIAGTDLWYNVTAIVHFIPFVNNVRSPDRFILLVFIFGTLFMARVVHLQWKAKSIKLSFTVFLLASVILFYLEHAQQDMESIFLPASKRGVLLETKGENVLMLPFGIRDGYHQFGEFDENHLLLQQWYEFKMPSGYLSRLNDETWSHYKSNELYANLALIQQGIAIDGYDWHAALVKNDIDRLYLPKASVAQNRNILKIIESLPATQIEDKNGILFSLYK